MYQITSNGFYFGLSLNGKEVLPCHNNRLWRITTDLVGFRQGKLFGVFSLSACEVVHEPVLPATVPYFKRAEPDRKNKTTRPRILSDHGYFEKHTVYLERCDYLFWQAGKLYLQGPEGIVVIHRHKGLKAYKGTNPALGAYTLKQRCLYEGEYGEPNVARLREFRYMTHYDERIDEANFLEEFAKGEVDLDLDTGAPGADQEEREDDEEDEEDRPGCRHYDYEAIPLPIRQKLHQHLDRLTNNKTYEWLARVLIYMAWCHANSLVTYNKHGEFDLDPPYALPPEDAVHVFDATMLYEAHRMEQVQHLLYLSPVTGTYYDVLVFEN